MSNWKNININKQNIETQTARSVLIKFPHNSDYDGYKFWHPAKLVRDGRHSNAVSIGYNDDFTFRIFKNGKGKYNSFDKIDEQEISAVEFEEAFGVMDETISAPELDGYVRVDNPEFKTPTENQVAPELSL